MAATSKFHIIVAWFLLALFFLFHISSASKLNVPRVLLPYSPSAVINFTLEVTEGGCYKWQSIRPEIVSVQSLDVNPISSCSTRAVVTVVTRHPQRQTSLVLAQDDATGTVLHCDVIVDLIYALEIVRTTAELYLDDAPEMIIARAKDKNGDTFSSLEGLLFKWSLITDTESDDVVEASSVVKLLPFSKSKYDAPVSIQRLETQGNEGYMVLLEGKTTGSAKITTRLLDDIYKDILSEEVSLYVVANVILNPATDVYLLIGSSVHYKVERLQQGKAFEISMPSDQFFLDIVGPAIIELNSDLGDVTGIAVGTTTIKLKDRNMGAWEPLRQPISRIHVVNPDHLEMKVEPYGSWLLEVGRPYWLTIEAYDDDNNRIFPSDDLHALLGLPERSFQLISSTENGTYYHVIPTEIGVRQLDARLIASGRNKLSESITLKKTVEICEPVTIDPYVVTLPWDPNLIAKSNVNLKAKGGGNASYHWSSNDKQIANVDQDGRLTTHSAGVANVTAASSRNPYLTGTALIIVLPVIDLHIVASELETEVGQVVSLPVALFGDGSEFKESATAGKVAFTDCRTLALKVELSDNKKFEPYLDVVEPPIGGGCVTLKLKALSEGTSQVTVRYFNGATELRKTAVIAAYKPLQSLVPKDEIILALGSAMHLAFFGGPRAWILKPESHLKKVNIENETLAAAQFVDNQQCEPRDAHVFVVSCLSAGRTTVTLKVGNEPSASLPKPLTASSEVIVTCGIPSSMTLQPVIHGPKLQKTSCLTPFRRLPVQCYRNLDVIVSMLDEVGRQFDNVTSLLVQWDISNSQLASVSDAGHLHAHLSEEAEGSMNCYQATEYVYETLKLHGKEGALRVKAAVIGYQSEDGKIAVHGAMSNVLDLELVEDAAIEPDKIAIFNHPDNIVSFTVQKGSGHFDITPKTHTVANLFYEEETHLIKVIPILDGSFTVTVYDLCLESKSTASAAVRVTGLKAIDVVMSDKVELNKEVHAMVKLLDPEGHCLPVSVSDLTNLHPVTGSTIITVKPMMANSENPCLVTFVVQGLQLGHTTLIFQANVTQTTAESTTTTVIVASDQLQIQVFSPLHIYPSNITLIEGAVFQVTSSGGPQPQTHIEYSVEDNGTAIVSPSGLITALTLGHTTVVARAIGVSPDTGASVIYSQDKTDIFIVELVGIRIHAPLTRMKSGTEMLVYATGINEHEVPFSFATAKPSLLFEWSISDEEIASLHSIYEQCGIVSEIRDAFVIRLVAKRPGQVTLSLKISSQGSLQKLTDTLHVQVFEKLDLVSPAVSSGSILLTPNTELKLQTNRDIFTRVSYRVVSEAREECISVDSAGLLKTGHLMCEATVLFTAHEEFGVNQSMNVLVEVKLPSYLVLTSSTVLTMNQRSLTSFPVGGTMLLHLSLHDNVGNKFQMSSVFLNYRPNRFDHVEIIPDIKNTTYSLRALKPGVSIIKFWHSRNPRVETFINFVSGENIFPSRAEMVFGDVVCFTSPLLTPEGNKGHWRSDNGLVASVDPQTGLTSLESIGSAKIQYELSPEFILRTDITVHHIQSIAILEIKYGYITNAWSGRVFDIAVMLSGKEKRQTANSLAAECYNASSTIFRHRVPFVCELSFTDLNLPVKATDVFDIESAFDLDTGNHVCRVRTTASLHARLSLSTVSVDLNLRVTVPVQGLQREVKSPTVVVPFVPAFHVMAEELQLTTVNSATEVSISATEKVFNGLKIAPRDRNILDVLSAKKGPKSSGVHVFTVRLKDGCWDPGDKTLYIDIKWENEKALTLPVHIRFFESGSCRPNQPQYSGWSKYLPQVIDYYKSYLILILCFIASGIAIIMGAWSIIGRGTTPVNPDAFATQQSTRSFLFRPAGLPGASGGVSPTPPGRTLLWSEGTPVHPVAPMPASSTSSPLYKSNSRSKFDFT